MSVTKNGCLIVRFVDVSHRDIKVVEYFIEFLIVENATGKGLLDLLLCLFLPYSLFLCIVHDSYHFLP
jgi:hypothetical protein